MWMWCVHLFSTLDNDISAEIRLSIHKKRAEMYKQVTSLCHHKYYIPILLQCTWTQQRRYECNRRGEWIPVSTPSRHKNAAAVILWLHVLLPCVFSVSEKWFFWASDDFQHSVIWGSIFFMTTIPNKRLFFCFLMTLGSVQVLQILRKIIGCVWASDNSIIINNNNTKVSL